jgi:LEA14-like dessication related protein
MKNLKLLLPVLFSAFLLVSCESISPLSVSKFEDVNVKSINTSGVALEVTMVVKNPNAYRFKMVDNQLNLFVNKTEMGTVSIKDKIVVPRKSEKSYTFLVETQFSNLALGSIPSLINIFMSKQVELKLVGDVKVRSMMISKRFPIEIIEKVPLTRDKK